MKRTSSRIASRSSEASPAQSVLKSAKRKAEERNRVDTTAAASKKAWTCKEKEQLIAGLKSYGSADLKGLAEAVPSKSEESIKNYIRKFKRWQDLNPEARLQSEALSDLDPGGGGPTFVVGDPLRKEPDVPPIDCWIKMMEGDIQYNALKKEEVDANLSSVVPTVLEFIAQNEEHPKMSESNKVDYAGIYEALAQVSRGEVPRQLNDESSAKLLSMISALKKPFSASGDVILKEAREKLSRYRQTDMSGSEEQGWEDKMSMPGTNPFKLPIKYFQVGGDEDSSEDKR